MDALVDSLLTLEPSQVRTFIDDVKYAQPPIGLIICDEGASSHLVLLRLSRRRLTQCVLPAGHRLKSEKAKTTQALQSLSCMRRIILSGTPIQNNLGEFFAMLGASHVLA